MPIYKLEPVEKNLDHQNWEASSFRGDCIVRACSENKARQTAYGAFGMAVKRPPLGQKIPNNPWAHPDIVSISVLTDHEYEEDGPEGVLYPTL
jgi:hypothetical protein